MKNHKSLHRKDLISHGKGILFIKESNPPTPSFPVESVCMYRMFLIDILYIFIVDKGWLCHG